MSDVIVIEQCCCCRRNLAKDKLHNNVMDGTYCCKDTEDCLNARSETVEPEILRSEDQNQTRQFNRRITVSLTASP